MEFPQDLYYTSDHEWIRVEGEIATVGITAFATDQLGDIVYVEIETEGETLDQGEEFGSVEAVKTVSELYMPVSGEVAEINAALEDAPETVNSDPYGEGWMIKIKLTNPDELEGLMKAAAYQAELPA